MKDLTKEEFEAFKKDMDEVLTKHNVEIGTTSTITVMKFEEEVTGTEVASPYVKVEDINKNEGEDTQTNS